MENVAHTTIDTMSIKKYATRRRVFYAPTLKIALSGVLCHIRSAFWWEMMWIDGYDSAEDELELEF